MFSISYLSKHWLYLHIRQRSPQIFGSAARGQSAESALRWSHLYWNLFLQFSGANVQMVSDINTYLGVGT